MSTVDAGVVGPRQVREGERLPYIGLSAPAKPMPSAARRLDNNLKVYMCEVNGDPGLDYPDKEVCAGVRLKSSSTQPKAKISLESEAGNTTDMIFFRDQSCFHIVAQAQVFSNERNLMHHHFVLHFHFLRGTNEVIHRVGFSCRLLIPTNSVAKSFDAICCR